jgi:threonine dehydratase
VSGGSIDVNVVSRIIERGLAKSGRLVRLIVTISDVTGALAQLTGAVASARGNILEIHHDRAFAGVGEATVELVLETKGASHTEEIRARLRELPITQKAAKIVGSAPDEA